MSNSNWATTLTPERVEVLKKHYREENWEQFLLKLSNNMKQINFILQFEDGYIYQASYIAEVVKYLTHTLDELLTGRALATHHQAWLKEQLPSGFNPKIEIGPSKILAYVSRIINSCPNKELDEFKDKFANFCTALETAGLEWRG